MFKKAGSLPQNSDVILMSLKW